MSEEVPIPSPKVRKNLLPDRFSNRRDRTVRPAARRHLAVALLVLTGCAFPRFEGAVQSPCEPAPCAAPLRELREATCAGDVRERVRTYLQCLAESEEDLHRLPARVDRALRRNPRAVPCRREVVDHFFDLRRLEVRPGAPASVPPTVALLRDQALARTAMGQPEVARDARIRAERLEGVVEELRQMTRTAP